MEVFLKKFILIELLVVLAIIGILISMLLPSLSKAREKSRSAVCKSNQKQLGLTIELHKTDNNDRLPKSVGAVNGNSANLGDNQVWKYKLNVYLQLDVDWDSNNDESIYSCPSRNQSIDNMKGGFGWNNKYLAYAPTDNDDEAYQGYKFFDITKPSETLVIADTVDNSTFHNKTVWRHKGKMENIANRHSGGLNILWADSHVSYKRQVFMLAGKDGKQHYYLMGNKMTDRD